jgi:hypothetical protein
LRRTSDSLILDAAWYLKFACFREVVTGMNKVEIQRYCVHLSGNNEGQGKLGKFNDFEKRQF